MIKPEDITIIIPTLCRTIEQQRAFDLCIKSLKETINSKIVIAKNGGIDSEFMYSDISLMEQGQCMAVNAAVATVNTPWVFITNDDMMYPNNGWLHRLTKYIGKDSMCVSPTLVEPRTGAPPFLIYFCGGAGGDFDSSKWEDYAMKHRETGSELGFNFPLLIKKELWDVVGGYDVNYDPWGSNGDSDLQAKIHLAGSKTVRVKDCIVYHFSQTSRTFHPENRPYWQKNWDYFIEKWGFDRQADKHKVWYSNELIDYDKLKYNPKWKGIYGQPNSNRS